MNTMTEVTTERPVIYDNVEAISYDSEAPLTAEEAKNYLGWTTPQPTEDGTPGPSFTAGDTHLRDREGTTVWCDNVAKHQRVFYRKAYETILWDILSGNWVFNGESAIIGKTGYVLDGKHRLTALTLADQEYRRNPERYPNLSGPPTIQLVVVTGVEESQQTVQTIGTGKPRSLADSIFSSGIFSGRKRSEVLTLSKVLDNAIRLLWDRTGASENAYYPVISHSEAMDFVERHPTLVEMVQVVVDENGGAEKRLSKYLTLGYFSGLAYLMAAGGSDGEQYWVAPVRDESLMDFHLRDQVEDFLVRLAHGEGKTMNPLRDALAKLDQSGGGSAVQRISYIAKAWNVFRVGEAITPSKIKLRHEMDDHGIDRLVEFPTVGGVDCGPTSG